MLVTIISDASVDVQAGTAGYGFWAVSCRGRYAGHGVFKGGAQDSNSAEMMAVINAIHITLRTGIAQAGDSVLVQTDSAHAISHFTKKVVHKNSRAAIKYRPMVNRLDEIATEFQLRVLFRHVKGHSRERDSRSVAQRMADKRAKAAMRRAREVSSDEVES